MTHHDQSRSEANEADLLRLLAENVHDYAIFVIDGDRRVQTWTAGAERLLGYQEAEILGESADIFFTREDRKEGVPEREVNQALQTGKGDEGRWHVKKDGSRFWSSGMLTPLFDEAETLRGFAKIMRDRTDLKRAEIAQSDALAYAENIIDTVREPLVVLDRDLRVRTANRSFYRTYKVSPEITEGHLIYDLGNRQWDIPKLRTLLEEILPQNTTLDDFEVEHDFKEIGHRSMLLNARKLYREGNHSELILLAIEDVTEQSRLEAERQEIETRFTSLVRNIRDHSIFTLDTCGTITSWNSEAERILGYSEAEAVGLDFSKIFTPEDVEAGKPEWELRTAREEGRAEDERWHLKKSGERFWALGIVTPMSDPSGQLIGYSKILRDMTARKRAEEGLQRSEERLRLLWEAAEALLTVDDLDRMLSDLFAKVGQHLLADAYIGFVTDETGQRLRLASWSGLSDEAAEKLSILELGQAIGGSAAERREGTVVPFVQISDDPRATLLKSHGFRAYACHPLRAGERLIGTLSFASQSKNAFGEDELEFLGTLARYVTLAYERLRLIEELRQADRRKDEFLAMLAHELRNPLAPIKSGLDLLQLSGAEPEIVGLMAAQVELAIHLVDDLLDVSRILRGRTELRKEQTDLVALVRQSIAMVQQGVDQHGQTLAATWPPEPILLEADPIRLTQVFINLLHNASKYTEDGGRIRLIVTREGDEAVISISDTGIGIDSNLLPKVFNLFTQADQAMDRSQGGLGIGLTIVKSLVELHGGTVSVRSPGVNQGSTFTVRLPILTLETRSENGAPADAPATSCRILVVDDNVPAAKLLARLLEKLGNHQVITAHDGPTALTAAEEFHPDLVLLDIGLPKMDGYEVARRLRTNKQLSGTLLVALTGYGAESDRQRSSEAGFDDHLVKPPSIKMLREVLAHPKLRHT